MSAVLDTFVVPLDFMHVGPTGSSSAGESHHREGQFPPPASTWQGLLRSGLLRSLSKPPRGQEEIDRLLGGPESLPEGWSVEGPWPAEEAADGRLLPWLPAPAWLRGAPAPPSGRAWFDSPGESGRYEIARPLPAVGVLSGGTSGAAWSPWGTPSIGVGETPRGWLPATELFRLLGGAVPEQIEVRARPPFVRADLRPGVALGDGKRPQEGMLYFLEAQRFVDGAGLYGGVVVPPTTPFAVDALHRGRGEVGRKGRPVAFLAPPKLHPTWAEYVKGAHLTPKRLAQADHVWIGLATPAALDDDARAAPTFPVEGPVALQVVSRIQEQDHVQGGLRRFTPVGPSLRPNRAYVPAGSGWLVRLGGGTPEERATALRALHHHCLVGPAAERGFGSGRLYVGLIPSEGA